MPPPATTSRPAHPAALLIISCAMLCLAPIATAQATASGNDADSGLAPPRPLVYIYDGAERLQTVATAVATDAETILETNNLDWPDLRNGQALLLPPPPADATLPPALSPDTQFGREIWRGIRGRKRVALTFDSGGDPDAADLVLQTLRETGAPATFFVTGAFAKRHPGIIRAIADAGHPVCNHSWSHPDLTRLSDERIIDELARTDDIITSITGRNTKPYWRPPFGARDRRVLRVAADAGYQSVYWTLDSLDSVPPPKPRDFVVRRILSPPAARDHADDWLDGAIILMHIGEPETARALPLVITQLRQRGFTLVTVSELLEP